VSERIFICFYLFFFCVFIVKLNVVCLILAEWNALMYDYFKKQTD